MLELRQSLLATARQLAQTGLNKGTAGNVSVRTPYGLLITPSGMQVEDMAEDSLVAMGLDGNVQSEGKPSSEWRFHCDIYQARPEICAVVHTHSMFATTMACLQKEIPPFHYMIAVVGGENIRCAPYALFGTQALSDAALQALIGRRACLLAHHGMIAIGADLQQALNVAVEVEALCEQYWRILQITPTPHLLTQAEMQAVFAQFKDYGQWAKK